MIDIINKTKINYDINQINEIYNLLTDKDVELILTDDNEIRLLNKQFRNKDETTDVLSFPLTQMPKMPIGSIVISTDAAKKEALNYGHNVKEEISLLFLHGLLHLLGYDHETDNGEMRKKEEEIIFKLNLPKSLIIRNNSDIITKKRKKVC